MEKFIISSQNETIDLILLAFKEVSTGIGIYEIYDIEVIKGEYSSTMVFTSKDGREVKPADLFMLGYFVGRDFEKRPCKACKRRMTTAIQRRKALKKNKS